MSRPPKPFSKPPTWLVGRDFPHPNDRFQGTVPSNPAPARPTQSIPIAPAAAPKPTPPLYRDEGRAAAPTALPPPAPPHSAPPSAAEAQPRQQPPSPTPPKTRPTETSPHPPASNIQNNYHSGKCSICNHPDRADIEAAFLNWYPAERIVAEFNLPARSTLYRHAKAANLLNQRRNNFRSALDQIIEQAGRVPATARSIISAIELSYRLSGADIAPLKRIETTHIYISNPNSASAPRTGQPSTPPAVRPTTEPEKPPKQIGTPKYCCTT